MLLKINIQRLFSFLLLFFVLYGPRLKSIDLMMISVIFVSCMSLLSLRNRKIEQYNFIILGGILFQAIYSTFHLMYTGSEDYTYLGVVNKYVLYFFSAEYILYRYYLLRSEQLEAFSYDLLFSTSLNGLFVICNFFFQPFKNFSSGFLGYDKQLNWLETGHRTFDLSLGGGATGSLVFALVFLFGISLINDKKTSFYFCLGVIVISCALMGRTGLYAIIIMLIFNILFRLSLINIFKVTLAGVVICFFIVYVAKGYLSDSYISWISQGLIGENDTADALMSMWIAYDEHYILGSGHYGREDLYFIPSDIGYVRIFNAGGLFGVISVFFIWFGLPLIFTYRRIISSNLFSAYFIFFTVSTLILLMNFKELHLASRGSGILFFMAYIISNKNRIGSGGLNDKSPS